MAPKTTSGSGFHFIFVIYVVDLVDNATNLENVHPTLFREIWPQSLKIQKLFKRVTWILYSRFFDILWTLGPSNIVLKFSPLRLSLMFLRPFTFFGLSFFSGWFCDLILCKQLPSSISHERHALGGWNLQRLLTVGSTMARCRNCADAPRLGGRGAPEKSKKTRHFKN